MLHNTSSRLGDCKELLNEAIDVLEARETSMTRKQRCNQNNQEVYLTYN